MSNSFICNLCTDLIEFNSLLELRTHMQTAHSSEEGKPMPKETHRPVNKTPDQPKSTRVPIPLNLQYKFIGECPTCFQAVDTIEIELPNENAVTAYCVSCKNKIMQMFVIPIHKQHPILAEPLTKQPRTKKL